MFKACVVLAQDPHRAFALVTYPGSPFFRALTLRDTLPIGGSVYGAEGLIGPAVATIPKLADTLVVAWDLHPQDHAINGSTMVIPDRDPATVLRRTEGLYVQGDFIPLATVVTRVPHFVERDTPYRPKKVKPAVMPHIASRWTKASIYALVRDTAVRMGVDPPLALGVAQVESGFNPAAISPAGAMGVMQLMPATAITFGVNDPFDPFQNVSAGVALLKIHLDRFRSTDQALAAYHSGRGNIERRGISPRDRQYIDAVDAARSDNRIWIKEIIYSDTHTAQ